MKQSELYYGKVVMWKPKYGRAIAVQIVGIGVHVSYTSSRANGSLVYLLDDEGKVRLHIDDESNRKYRSEEIGKPISRKVLNRELISVSDWEAKQKDAEDRQRERDEIRAAMEAGREYIHVYCRRYGFKDEDVDVYVKYNAETGLVEHQSVRFTGEGLDMLIRFLRDFKPEA